jgi:hypothetical protein
LKYHLLLSELIRVSCFRNFFSLRILIINHAPYLRMGRWLILLERPFCDNHEPTTPFLICAV